ncbi:MAG: hypothetical protein U1F41_13565 [Burkholderiales bacterium]
MIRGLRLRRSRLLAILFVAVLASLTVFSCSLYNNNHSQEGGAFDPKMDFVLQVDDYGSFWEPQTAERLLRVISENVQRTNVAVVVFIHGWHHNAQPDDDNARDFAESMRKLREAMDDKAGGTPGIYRQSRTNLTGNGDIEIYGVYIGWRGKSLPEPLDYVTFWDRKSGAERVGDGDVREFLLRLNRLYSERSALRATTPETPYLGLIGIGHSFGGQVLFRAVSHTFEAEIIQAAPYDANVVSRPLTGFGDLTVLINPALEAFQYQRIHQLNKRIHYPPDQTPLLLVISSATDTPRQTLFPLGRVAAATFRASFRDDQRELWTKALGEYEPHRTHLVEITSDAPVPFDPKVYLDDPCAVVRYDLTTVPSIAGVKLAPLPDRVQPYGPFLVAYASGEVVLGHTGIFERQLREFLNQYVAITSGKRQLLASPKARACVTSDATSRGPR